MISTRTLGYNGLLGNQMFQYATAFALSKFLNTEYVIPEENTKIEQIVAGNKSRCFLYDVFPNLSVKTKPQIEIHPTSVYSPSGFNFDINILNQSDGVDLIGFFQSEKWFKPAEEEIRSEFRLEPILSDKKGFIHVRRGDYCTKSDYHPHSDMDYYERAMSIMDKTEWLVFSDDPKWCRETFLGSNFEIVDADEVTSLRMMMGCDYAIIANSTFSWWGSWLGKCKTIAPKKWFGPSCAVDNWDDIYCENWLVL